MKTKKSPRANLEDKRFIFSQIGLILALTIVLFAFEWKSYDTFERLRTTSIDRTPEELIQITLQKKIPPKPKPILISALNIVGDDEFTIDEIEIFNIEGKDNTQLELYNPELPDEGNEGFDDNIPFVIVEEMPSFPGGEEARMRYLQDNLEYPLLARETKIQGSVFFSFIIEKDGSITNILLLRGIGGGCDEEARRVLENMPKWNPGKQRGTPVRVELNMEIKFKLL